MKAAAALALACAAQLPAQVVPELIKFMETGPRDKRVNMVIIGDGYTALDKAKFQSHLKLVADAVLKAPPLTAYEKYFNVYGIWVPSNQAGADDASRGITRDTYFGARYSGRLLTVNNTTGFSVINKLVPEADMNFAVVNSDTYGGSGGPLAVANYADPEIIAHEAQHSFSLLGDEYDYAGSSPFEAPNTTRTSSRAGVRWAHWIESSTPVPTPETNAYAKVPGVFEGAAYNLTGWFRPKLNCRMRENGIPFCEPCMEAILLAVHDVVSPIDSILPKPGAVNAYMNEAPALKVKAKQPADHAMRYTWTVDGLVQADQTGPEFTKVLSPGKHAVSVIVKDTTRIVRKDAKGLMSDTAAWQVTVSSTVRALAASPSAVPGLLRADARHLWLRAGAGKAVSLRLSAADGRIIEARDVTVDGAGKLAWSRELAPGAYLAEITANGRRAALRFAVAP